MPKKTIRRFLPDHKRIKENKYLQIFGSVLHSPNLWHLNRRSAAKAFAVGLFFAFVPVPFQMVLAAGVAIFVQANLPLSIALVWITNPLTMPAIFYGCYLVGTFVLDVPEQKFAFEVSWQWLANSLSTLGPAFLVGCAVLAVFFSIAGYVFINVIWRRSVASEWKKRLVRRNNSN